MGLLSGGTESVNTPLGAPGCHPGETPNSHPYPAPVTYWDAITDSVY
nr:MAG TPA: hypothetical protein [Caudoviricetes sp.]